MHEGGAVGGYGSVVVVGVGGGPLRPSFGVRPNTRFAIHFTTLTIVVRSFAPPLSRDGAAIAGLADNMTARDAAAAKRRMFLDMAFSS